MIDKTDMRAARGAETRTALIRATRACVARSGIEGATSREIAREADTNLQAIAYHFGSKDDLLADALLGAIKDWIEPALAILRKEMDPVRRMMLAVRELQRAYGQAGDLLPVYLEALAHARKDDAFAARVRELMHELHGFVSSRIADLKRKGKIPRWVDPDAMATLQIAAIDGVALHAALDPEGVNPRKVAAQGMRMLVAARKDTRKKGPKRVR